MTPIIREHATGIAVTIGDREISLSWLWLRDHARDPESFLASAQQRTVSPTTVAGTGRGSVEVDPSGDTLRVTWPNGPTADFDLAWLDAIGTPRAVCDVVPHATTWCRHDIVERHRPVPYDAAIGSDAGRRQVIELLWRDGLVQLHDVPIDQDATRAVLETIGYVRSTIFGDLWEFSSDGGFDDTASTSLEITPHTDGTYSHDAPGLLGLHCHAYDATGGENVFVDGLAVAERLSATSREVLSTVEIPAQYIGDGSHLMAKRPVLRHDGDRLVQVSYNHHDRAPFVLPESSMSEVYEALFEFDALANDPELQLDVAMRQGDMVIFDNWRLLHGRRAFFGERVIAGGYVNREDFESATRRLA